MTSFELPLNVIRRAFKQLLDAPCPPRLDGARIGAGLPARDLDLREIKAVLAAPETADATRRALWGAVVTRSNAGEREWTTVALGLAYPGLTAAFNLACRNRPGDWQDKQAELIAEFLVALGEIDLKDTRIQDVAGWLCSRALSASWKARKAEEPDVKAPAAPGAVIPLFPAGHPDIVLARAVRLGVLTDEQADLIGRAYLEDEHHTALAARYGISVATFYRRRAEAVNALVEAIEDGVLRPY